MTKSVRAMVLGYFVYRWVECPAQNQYGLWCHSILSTHVLHVQYGIGKGYGVAVLYLHVLTVQYGIGKGCGVALSTRVECPAWNWQGLWCCSILSTRVECPVWNWQGLWCCGILSTHVLNVQYGIGKGCGVAVFYLHVCWMSSTELAKAVVLCCLQMCWMAGAGSGCLLTIFVMLRSEHWCGQLCKHSELTT